MLTIAQAIARSASLYPENRLTYIGSDGSSKSYTMVEVETKSAEIAAGLQARGVKKGDRIGMILIDPEEFAFVFYGCLRLGAVAVPLYPPMSMADLDAYIDRLTRISINAEATWIIASERVHKVLWQVVDAAPSLKGLLQMKDLEGKGAEPQNVPELRPEETAFLQYTSGSTSDPKGVIVTHASLYENVTASCNHLEIDHTDTAVSWLPLYHDMGLIGFVAAPVIAGMQTVLIPTIRFLKRPNTWMELMHEHKASVTFCPPFALALAARRAKPADLERWDLSRVRVVGVGAEPIQPAGVRQFTELFSEHCGMPTSAVIPAYGMAEATLAITMKPVNAPFKTIHLDHAIFQTEKRVVLVEESDTSTEFVSCGVTFPRHEVAIFDEEDNQLPAGVEGEIHYRGPSVTGGYFKNAEETASAYKPNGWLATGDLGFLHDGEIYVSGRLKDLIIINGRNIHPQSIEWPLYNIDGVRPGNVVAFSRRGATTEEVVICIETTTDAPEDLEQRVRDTVSREFGIPVQEVVLLQAGQLPKTSSGKLQRRLTRKYFEDGTLTTKATRTMGSSGARITVAKHVAKSFVARVKNLAAR